MIRGLLAACAATLVMIGFASPLVRLWPYMIEWYGFPIMVAWFAAAVHFSARAAIWMAGR